VMRRAAQAYARVLRGLTYNRLAGIPYAALPIGMAVALETNEPLVYPRKEAKEYGTKAAIEGAHRAGEVIAVIDDLISSGESKFEAIEKLESAGLVVKDVIVLIDRSKNAKDMLGARGYALHSVVSLPELAALWQASGAISAAQAEEIRAFLAG
jgi:uridine monophosphate synthetase